MRLIWQLLAVVAVWIPGSFGTAAAKDNPWLALVAGVLTAVVAVLVYGWVVRRTEHRAPVEVSVKGAGAGVGWGTLLGVAIGFGAQSLIKDFLSGIFIIVENQYRVGDIVDIQGAAGTVERVTIRSTVIRDASGNVHFLPNGEVLHVINKTMGFSKVNFTLTVDPDTDIDKLSTIIDEVGLKLSEDEKWKEKILEAPHFLNIGTFNDIALEVTIIGKTNPSQQWSVTGEMRRRLLKAFAKHKIELAHIPGLPSSDKK